MELLWTYLSVIDHTGSVNFFYDVCIGHESRPRATSLRGIHVVLLERVNFDVV